MATVKGGWVFNEEISELTVIENVIFSSGGVEYNTMTYDGRPFVPEIGSFYVIYENENGKNYVYDLFGWGEESYRTVDFGVSEQEVSEEFFTWLTANATQQLPIVSIAYGGAELTTLSVDETVSLHTNGNRMSGDVEVTTIAKYYDGSVDIAGEPYAPGEGTEIYLQEKTITQNGEYTADSGYDGLSKVIVNVPTGTVEEYDGTIIIE